MKEIISFKLTLIQRMNSDVAARDIQINGQLNKVMHVDNMYTVNIM